MRRRWTQWLRRAAQTAALLLPVSVAAAAGYRSAHPAVGSASAPAGLASRARGNTWSFALGPLSLTDPLAGLESLVAGREVVAAMLAGVAIPAAASLLLGRVFCSWLCPAGFLFEVADRARGAARRRSRRRNAAFWRGNKHALLGVGLAASALLSVPLLALFYPPALLARELHNWARAATAGAGPWRAPVTWGSLALLGLVLFEAFVSRRAWCRYFCPGGALYILLGVRRLVRVTGPDEASCDRCGRCVTACGMGLDPMQGITGAECDNCLACLTACPPGALHLSAGRSAPSPAAGD